MAILRLIMLFLLTIAAHSAHNWSTPCFGECSWDISSGSVSGTVRIAGPHAAVSDITFAAGWRVIDCSPDTDIQDIRLVCQDPDKGCDHLYQNTAVGTLVRLPEDCGSIPFALVTREWVHQDQSIPASKLSTTIRRDGSQPIVKGMSLVTNWIEGGQHGNVTFFLMGSSLPGAAGNFTVYPPNSTGVTKRELVNWVDASLDKLSKAHAKLPDFNKNLTASSAINFDKDLPIVDKKLDCPQNGNIPAFLGEIKVDLDGRVGGNVNYGVAAAGSIVPPKLDEFGLFVGLDATIAGTLGLGATLTGSISSGKIPLFEAVIPELNFPKILSIGPTFLVNAEATALVDTNLDLDVGIAYSVKGLQLFYPRDSKSKAGQYSPVDSNMKLSVSPNVTSHGQVVAHLIPSLAFELSALGGKADATISLDLDADAALDLSLTASATAETPTNGTNGTAAAFGGCVDITTSLTINAGADADFFGLFNKSTTFSLYQRTFDLYKRCFSGTPTCALRPHTDRVTGSALLSNVHEDNIACPPSSMGAAATIVSGKRLMAREVGTKNPRRSILIDLKHSQVHHLFASQVKGSLLRWKSFLHGLVANEREAAVHS